MFSNPVYVESSAIKCAAYDEENKVARITFNSGADYDYYGVPREEFDAMLSAPSVGKYFNQYIKPYSIAN